ncbi:hypothetical protein P7C70_g7381, partial [Phenoliferia sp. Uapishka_3]
MDLSARRAPIPEEKPQFLATGTLDPRSDLSIMTPPRATPNLSASAPHPEKDSSIRKSTAGKRPPFSAAHGSAVKRLPAKAAKLVGGKPSKQTSCEGCRRVKTKCDRTSNCRACKLRDEPCVWKGCIPTAPAEPDELLDDCPRASAEILRLRKLVANLTAQLEAEELAAHSRDRCECFTDEDFHSNSSTTSCPSARSEESSRSHLHSPMLDYPYTYYEYLSSLQAKPQKLQQETGNPFPILTSPLPNFAPSNTPHARISIPSPSASRNQYIPVQSLSILPEDLAGSEQTRQDYSFSPDVRERAGELPTPSPLKESSRVEWQRKCLEPFMMGL